jgi:hypothetical protein
MFVIINKSLYYNISNLLFGHMFFGCKYFTSSHLQYTGFNKYKWKAHRNFNPSLNNDIERAYNILKIKKNVPCLLVLGITEHASQRMLQRKVTTEMVAHTLKYGILDIEGPQKTWDMEGRKTFTWKNMVVVTNYDQNRIVTVYWKIKEWEKLKHKEEKKLVQKKARRQWCKLYSKFYNNKK